MKNSNYKLICTKHPNQRFTSINVDENNADNSRLLCSSCLTDLLNENFKQKSYQLLDIDEFIKNPIQQLQRIMKYDGSKTFCNIDYLQQFEKEINLIKVKFEQTIIGLKTCVKHIRNQQDKYKSDFEAYLKLNILIDLYKLATQQNNDKLKQKYIKSFEENLNFVCQNLTQAKLQANANAIKNQEVITNMFSNYLKTSIQDINRLQEVATETFNLNNIQGLPIQIYGELKNFPQIHYKISEGKAISYQLLYQGSKDGLNLEQFYSKCQNQSNLLTIITTKNGNKFGGYSPCQLKNNEVDAQLKSFLFQYDRQEIYKIKNQMKVYNMNQQQCQVGDQDLSFNNNLTFSSNLGMSYDISNYDIKDRRAHIFGEPNPQIIEFKVYKVIFQ